MTARAVTVLAYPPSLPMQAAAFRDRAFRSPAFLLAVAAVLAAFVVQSGETGSSDTQHRLQATHSFWTSEPAVFPQEYPEFGIHGRDGRLYGWYGIGQSLLLLPSDVVGTQLERLPVFRGYRRSQTDPTVRNVVVTYSTNTLICVLSVLVCFRFLRRLEFTVNQSVAGSLSLLFATSFLHYTQNMMENNLILLLTLTGFCFQYEWFRTGRLRLLLVGSTALGCNLMIRLTTSLDLGAAAFFMVLLLWMEGPSEGRLRKVWTYARAAAPCYALGLLVDRLYQYERFGSLLNTYVSIFAAEQRKIYPDLPAGFPWTTPLRVGLLGPLVSPEKSVFLFDPLVILTVLLAVFLWRRMAPEIRAYLCTGLVLVAVYVLFYARFYDWSGDFAWGDRYVSTAVQLVAFISVPLLLRHQGEMARFLWATGIAVIVMSVLVQVASVFFWFPLEIYQMMTLGHPTFVVGLRFKNIAAFLLGKMDGWGLTNEAMTEDAWDYVHITTFDFLPFVLERVGAAPRWLADVVMGLWSGVVVALLCLLAFLGRQARLGKLAETA